MRSDQYHIRQGQKMSQWADHFLQKATMGDAESQIAVGWEYVRGIEFTRDLKEAEKWFRKAQDSAGELAVFNLIKMYLIENDPRITDVYKEGAWKMGAIHYLYAHYLKEKHVDNDELVRVLNNSVKSNHLGGRIMLHQSQNKGLMRIAMLPFEFILIWKFLRVWWKNSSDERVLR